MFSIAAAGPRQNKQDKQASDKSADQQEAQERLSREVIPPPPMIVEREPNSVSVPSAQASAISKYETRMAASTKIKIGSQFGYRRDPFTRRERFHAGMDIHARWGDPVGASLAGVISFAGWVHGYGNEVVIDHGGGVTTHYAHLSSFAVSVGDQVKRGTVIGYAGSTGRATAPHLHYEVRIDGTPVNPLETVALDPSSEFFTRLSKTAEAAASAAASKSAEPGKKQPADKAGKGVKPALVQERPRRVTPLPPGGSCIM